MSAIIEYDEGKKQILVVNVHGPNDKSNSFFADLGIQVNGNPKKQKMIILCDIYAHIGKMDREKDDYKLFGNYIGYEKSNENGECMKMI